MKDKSLYMRTLVFILIVLLFAACSQSPNTSEAKVSDTETSIATLPEEIEASKTTTESLVATEVSIPVPAAPAPTKKRKANEEKQAAKSVFLDLGCCAEVESRSDDCCCSAVLEKYKALLASNDLKLAEYKTKDPIFGNCRRKMAKEFEQVEYPEEGEEEEDDGAF